MTVNAVAQPAHELRNEIFEKRQLGQIGAKYMQCYKENPKKFKGKSTAFKRMLKMATTTEGFRPENLWVIPEWNLLMQEDAKDEGCPCMAGINIFVALNNLHCKYIKGVDHNWTLKTDVEGTEPIVAMYLKEYHTIVKKQVQPLALTMYNPFETFYVMEAYTTQCGQILEL